MSAPDWSPAQYERFKAERTQPFFDLAALVQPRPGLRVLDLGCGTGELTCALHQQLGAASTLGIDSSPAMLANSAAFAGDGLRFERHDIGRFRTAERFDLVFSNAALQWLPNQARLFARLTELLADGGQLAVQVPANQDYPSHTVAAQVAREEPFASAIGTPAVRHRRILKPEAYAALLDRLGYRAQHVRLQVYGHHLASRADVVEWVKGTLLVDYQKRLTPEMFSRFLERYRERLLPCLEDRQPFFYPFKRLLLWARR